MTATCHIIFCMIVRVMPKISSQNFMKNVPNLSQEIEKNTENVPPCPPKKPKLKIAPSKGQYPP